MKMKLVIGFLFLTLIACGQDDTFNKVMHFPQGATFGTDTEIQLKPFLGSIATDTEWDNIKNKPEVFPPDMSAVPSIELQVALEQLGIYFGKTTEELEAIIPADGFGIAYDRTLGVYKVYSNGWRILPTTN
jgi:hypothetical protein